MAITPAQRKALKRAERLRLEAMTDEELERLIADGPPDPEFDAALPYLTEAELELALGDLLTRKKILALARSRGADIKETDK